ncbi:MAG: hypothetical protein IIY33_00250 [Erysipelotrichaceae bacterium]|nr:hypothetical protein [Erysipelotrichaceae bacterium]
MSQKYDEYLSEHVANVQKAGQWLMDHGIVPFDDFACRNRLNEWLMNHDESKRSTDEYEAYDDYFYGKEGKDEAEQALIDDCFDYAWLHHIHQNSHHWQYWVLIGDDEKERALEMPLDCVYHMIADWWSFSWKEGKLDEIFKWYEDHKKKMILHQNTRKLVEKTLDQIRELI